MDCKVSALLLALGIVTNNEELTKKLIEFAEEVRRYDISIDYQKLEADNSGIKQSADYTLKKQSAEMKFRALIFGSVLNGTEQGDEALKELGVEMAKSGDVIAEGLQLVELIDGMSLSNINELASIYFKGDVDKAKESLEALRGRINMYTASQYSAINSNVKRKVDDRVKAITKELDDARAFLSKEQYEFDRAMETLNYSEENLKKDKRRKNANIVTEAKKDLEILNKPSPKSGPEKKEYDKQLNKISKKYGFNQANGKRATKDNMIKKLNSILEADEIVKKGVDKTKVDILLKESEDALRGDLKLIKDGQNPYELVDLDREWKFAKDFDGSVEGLTKEYGYYAMAKAMLGDSQGNIPQNVYDAIKKIVSENKSMPDTAKGLTSDWILDEGRTLEELLGAAYIHTKELINNEELRNLWRQQILAKTSDDVLTQTDVAEIESILNAVRLSEGGANFSTVFGNISLAQTARALGIEVKNEEGGDLKKGIIKLMSDNDFETALKHVDQFKVSVGHKSVEIYKQDLLALVADILHIDNFYKAILNNDSTDKDLIRIAGMYLSGKSDLANSNLKALMNAAREAAPKSDDSKGLLLTAITEKNVNKDTKIAFFDIKKENKYTAGTSARRDFMNKITEINSLTVTDKIDVMEGGYEEMLSKLQRDFADGGYIIVNDSTWKNNSDLNRAIEKANEGKDYSKKIKVIYSRGGMMSSLNMVNGKLVFSMTDKSEFDKFVRTQAIAALGNGLEKDDVVKELMQKAVNGNIDDIKKYNDELEKVARNYFSEMFGVPNDDELFSVIEGATGMSFKDYSSIENKVDFWTKVDAVTTLGMKVSGNITNEVVKVADFVRSLRELEPEDVLSRINRMFGSDFTVDDITDERGVTDTIMDLFIRYNLSQDFTQLLENKGRLFAALNGASGDVLDMAQIKQAFQSGDFSIYKQVFNLDDEALAKYQKQINDILFEGISQQLADNLIDMGYTIPHARIQEVVLDWLNGKVNVNSEFAKKFLFRNNVGDSRDVYEAIIREAMPTEFNFKWDDFVGTIEGNGYVTRLVESENPFVQDTYSTLISLSAIKNNEILPGVGHEKERLISILQNYRSKVEEVIEKGNGQISFSDAQKLKQQVGYALDMFEQDYLSPKYSKLFTPQERTELFGLKYGLGIATNKDELGILEEYNEKIINRYDNSINGMNNKNKEYLNGLLKGKAKNKENDIDARQEQLIEKGYTMANVNGELIVVDLKQELLKQIKTLPDNVKGLESLKTLGEAGLEQFSNREAYMLLNVVELAKNADNKMNMMVQTLYQYSPILKQYDFFNRFKVNRDGVPEVMRHNSLTTDFLLKYQNTAQFDTNNKKSILSGIRSKIINKGKIEVDELNKIIDDAIKTNLSDIHGTINPEDIDRFKKETAMVYASLFNPYTYLRDIPKNVKKFMDGILNEQQRGLRDALSKIDQTSELNRIIDNVNIYTNDGDLISLREILDGRENNVLKNVLDTEDEVLKDASDLAKEQSVKGESETARLKREKSNEIEAVKTENNFKEALSAYLNESQKVADSEKKIRQRIMGTARTVLQQYSTTNLFSELDYSLSTKNDKVSLMLKNEILGFIGNLTGNKVGKFLFGNYIKENIKIRFERFKQVYMNIYNLSNAQLKSFKPKGSLENAAYNTVLYFKEIEHKLGSADGFRGVSLDQNINRAFYNIGEVVGNISPTRGEITDEDLAGIYSLISGIQNNSFLKFFIFANPNDLAYVRQFSDRGLIDSVGFTGYRKYVSQKDVNANREWFNTTFGTQMSETDFRIVMQGLSGYGILSDNAGIALLQRIINGISVSNFVDRAFTSRPGQLFTVRSQGIAYWLKQKFWEEDLGIEDMKKVNEIRKSMGILDNELTELRPFDEEWRNSLFHGINSNDELAYYNRYGIPNVDDVYDKVKLYTTEDLDSLYSKLNDYYSNEGVNINSILGLVDAYKDNANNLMDGLFNGQFKNISFVRALQNNNYIKFYTAEEFDNWLKNPNVSADMKNKAIEKIQADAGRHYKNILGLGFSGMDRGIGFAGGRISGVYQALVNLVSFRGAWGRTIANQVLDILETGWNAKAGLTQEGRDGLVRYLANQPEFLNFSKAMFNDIVNCWHLTRILDNGDFDPTEDETYNLMDLASYIEHVVDTIPEGLDVVSQGWQGLQSAGNTRIVGNWIASLYRWVNEDDYKDVMGIGALFNSINREFGRNWKFRNWAMGVIFKANSFEEGVEGLWNEWRKLSFGGMRYMFNTDEGAYGYSTEFIRDDSGIPSILTGQPGRGGDRTFQNEELNYAKTYMTLSSLVTSLSDTTEGVTKGYLTDLGNIMGNNSPFFGLIRNTYRLFGGNIGDLYTGEDGGQYVYTTKAGKALIDNGYYVPTEKDEIDIVLDEFLSKYRPGNESFNTSMFNFDKGDHMASTTESNYSDAEMEELLTNIKYKRNDAFEFELDDKGNKIVTDEWKRHMELMEQNYNYDDYLTVSNYNFIRNWVEENNSDPNYIKYNKLIAEGMLQRELTDKLTYIYNNENEERGLKGTDKATLTNIRNALGDKIYNVMYHTSEITGNTEPMIEVILSIDKIARDKSYIRMIEKELTEKGNRKEFEKYFYTDKDGNIQLGNKTKSWLEEQIKLADALEKGDLNRFRAETASITNIIKGNDPYGIVTLETMDSILNRINTSNKTAEEKLAAFDAILEDNVEFLQKHLPLLVEKYGTDVGSAMLGYANSLVYNIDKAGTNLVVQAEDDGSKKGISTGKGVSIKTKGLYNSLGGSKGQGGGGSGGATPKTYTFKVKPIELNGSKLLDITGGKGYTPKTYSMGDYVTQYKPHSNFEISKDVSRGVKKTKTQAISTKKQLSNIEAKTEKALTAEA